MSRISKIVQGKDDSIENIQDIGLMNKYGQIKQNTCITQEINHPSHYTSKSGKDVIDWCEDFGIMQNAYKFNIFKYLCRAGLKADNSELQDALKARVYLDRYIESLKK